MAATARDNRPSLRVSDVRFTAAGPHLGQTGLMGWVSCVVAGSLRLDGLTLRRTLDGRTVLSYPARDRRFPYYFPTRQHHRIDLERQIFLALDLEYQG